MWNDLMRRWMDMALWWVPGSRQSDDKPADEAPAQSPAHEPRQSPTQAQAQTQATPSATPDAPAHGDEDLTAIKGIGPAMQKRLAHLGVTTPAQLASADADELTKHLKAGGAVISRNRVAEWIEAARQA